MTARQLIVPGAMPSLDANGRALPAKLRFYLPSSGGEPTTVFTDNTLTVPHPFPILSNDAGRWPQIWASDALMFDVGWTDQVFDQVIQVFTNISPVADAILASVVLSQTAADEAAASDASAAIHDANAAASAAAAAAHEGILAVVATSITPLTIGTGLHTFTLQQTNTDFVGGMDIEMSVPGAVTNRMVATIQSFVDPVMVVDVPVGGTSGAGSHSSWQIGLTAIGGVVSIAALTGIISAAAAKAALAIAPADVVGFNAAVDARAAAFAIALR